MNEMLHNNHNKSTLGSKTEYSKDLSDLFKTSITDFPLHSTVFLDIRLDVKVEK